MKGRKFRILDHRINLKKHSHMVEYQKDQIPNGRKIENAEI